jgi:hypothetical protein
MSEAAQKALYICKKVSKWIKIVRLRKISESESESSLLQRHYSISATEIFLVTDIECLTQIMRFRADTCNICRRVIHMRYFRVRGTFPSLIIPDMASDSHTKEIVEKGKFRDVWGQKHLGNRLIFFTGIVISRVVYSRVKTKKVVLEGPWGLWTHTSRIKVT